MCDWSVGMCVCVVCVCVCVLSVGGMGYHFEVETFLAIQSMPSCKIEKVHVSLCM